MARRKLVAFHTQLQTLGTFIAGGKTRLVENWIWKKQVDWSWDRSFLKKPWVQKAIWRWFDCLNFEHNTENLKLKFAPADFFTSCFCACYNFLFQALLLDVRSMKHGPLIGSVALFKSYLLKQSIVSMGTLKPSKSKTSRNIVIMNGGRPITIGMIGNYMFRRQPNKLTEVREVGLRSSGMYRMAEPCSGSGMFSSVCSLFGLSLITQMF